MVAVEIEPLLVMPCRAGGYVIAIPASEVRDVEQLEMLEPSEEGPPLLGTLPEGVPVYDLAMLLGAEPSEGGIIVVLEGAVRPWGLKLDSLDDAVEAADLLPLPDGLGDAAMFFDGLVGGLPLLSPGRLDPEGSNAEMPRAIRERLERNVERKLPPISFPTGRLLTFTTRDFDETERPYAFGVPMQAVLEVMERPTLIALPAAPPHIAGLAIWRGQPIPVVDFAAWVSLETAVTTRGRLLVLRGERGPVGLAVPGEVRILKPPVVHQPSTRYLGVHTALLHAVVELRESTLALPNLETLLA